MSSRIHSTAVVDPTAELAEGVEIGPGAVVGPGVRIGEGTRIGAGAQIEGPTILGAENRVYPHACIGFDPQDLKFAGEETRLEVGCRNTFREFCTVHRGTGKGGGLTTVGDDNLFMVYTHVAHDCHVGSRTVFSNGGTLAGHVVVDDDAVIGAYSAVHQFCRVGRHAYIGGYSKIVQDPLPYAKSVGDKASYYGMNRIGLERKGMDAESLGRVERALRILVRGPRRLEEALELVATELGGHPEVDYLVEFVRGSERGVIRNLPLRRGRAQSG
ncbi:MAG: acyl-ACP--UDP-N-acetylglucosamine O-acyltransferase [Thermoanaerobaculia bacterium]